jgi:Uma2 family endonuclease
MIFWIRMGVRRVVEVGKSFQYDANRSQQIQDLLVREDLTYEDYASMSDEGVRYELASGKLEAMSPAPGPLHQLVLQELVDAIKDTCGKEFVVFIAPVDVILSNTEVRQPDLIMLHRSRMAQLSKRGIEGAPDLVAELLSPSSVKRDREDKRRSYARYGVPEYWIIDMNNTMLEQYVLEEGDYRLAEVYTDDAPIRSDKAACLRFTMKQIMDAIPVIP